MAVGPVVLPLKWAKWQVNEEGRSTSPQAWGTDGKLTPSRIIQALKDKFGKWGGEGGRSTPKGHRGRSGGRVGAWNPGCVVGAGGQGGTGLGLCQRVRCAVLSGFVSRCISVQCGDLLSAVWGHLVLFGVKKNSVFQLTQHRIRSPGQQSDLSLRVL